MRFADWLELREGADAAARAPDLVEPVRRRLAGRSRAVIHDLGSGTGSMTRWLAPRLPVPQHWVLYDRDSELLDRAVSRLPPAVTARTRRLDITRLTETDLEGADLVTASALLDMLTAEELDRVVAACVQAGAPVLLTISVTGRVELFPPDPLDAALGRAFDAHQRRTVGSRTLLGPDAVEAAAGAFRRYGTGVSTAASPWRLGPGEVDLTAAWLAGWVAAACEQRPELSGPATAYLANRLADAWAGRLRVVVHHTDVLAAACGEPPAAIDRTVLQSRPFEEFR